jgi:hypothetical protein
VNLSRPIAAAVHREDLLGLASLHLRSALRLGIGPTDEAPPHLPGRSPASSIDEWIHHDCLRRAETISEFDLSMLSRLLQASRSNGRLDLLIFLGRPQPFVWCRCSSFWCLIDKLHKSNAFAL